MSRPKQAVRAFVIDNGPAKPCGRVNDDLGRPVCRGQISQHEDDQIGRSQNDPDVVVTIADRRAHDTDCPDAGRRGVTRREVALSDDCARTDKTHAGDHTVQDICIIGNAVAYYGNRSLY